MYIGGLSAPTPLFKWDAGIWRAVLSFHHEVLSSFTCATKIGSVSIIHRCNAKLFIRIGVGVKNGGSRSTLYKCRASGCYFKNKVAKKQYSSLGPL